MSVCDCCQWNEATTDFMGDGLCDECHAWACKKVEQIRAERLK